MIKMNNMANSWDFTWDEDSKSATFIVDHPMFVGALDRIRACYESYGKTSNPRCVAIFGPSRVGKSTLINEFIKSLGRYNKDIVVVRLKTVKNTKALASQILRALGDPACGSGTESQMTLRIIHLLKKLKIKLLIIDDIQNIIDRKSQKLDYLSADLLRSIISDNEVKPSMVLLGLPNSKVLFDVNEQLKGRFRKIYLMKRFDWNTAETKKMLKDFLNVIQKNLNFEHGLELFKEELAFRFYCASNGLVGLLMKIIIEAKNLADNSGGGIITRQHLAEGYDEAICKDIDEPEVNPFTETDLEKLSLALLAILPKKERQENVI